MKNLFVLLSILTSINVCSQIPTDGLISFYPFSGNADDKSGNNYNGIVFGSTLTTDRFGNENSAYSFNGNNNYLDLSEHVEAFNFKEPMTISFWVKTDFDNDGITNFASTVFAISDSTGINNTSIFVGNNATGTLANEIALTNQQRSSSEKYIAGYTTTKRNKIINDKWHHLIFEYNGISTKIYIDAILVNVSCSFGINDGSHGNIPNASKMFIGARWANDELGAFMNGELDDLRIYDRVLNKNEINSLFNESKSDMSLIETEISPLHQFQIFPNPTHDELSVVWTAEINSEITLNVIDVYGNVVISERISDGLKNHILDIKTLPIGDYYIQFISEELQKSEQFVVE